MKSSFLRWNISALAAALLCTALGGCVAEGGYGYGGGGVTVDADVDTGADYYEPAGVVVGGWAPGYHVGPVGPDRGPGDGRPRPGETAPGPHPMGGVRPAPGGGGTHAYKPAPASHSAPSIPSGHRK